MRKAHLLVVAPLSVAILTVGMTSPALANAYSSSSSCASFYRWQTGENTYVQGHNGDDFGLDVTSGVTIDAAWYAPSTGAWGSAYTNIAAKDGRATLGTNFYAGTNLQVKYRASYIWDDCDPFSSTQTWNYSWK